MMENKPQAGSAFRPGRHFEVFDEPVNDPYAMREKPPEPTACPDCGAVWQDGRWQWLPAPAGAHALRCAACARIHDNMPAGYVMFEGEFAQSHREELLRLVRSVEAREKAEHPLQRIIAVADQEKGFLVTTTDVHLARALGGAVQAACKGELDYHYSRDDYLIRMHWQR